eukprot:CAMPEP_0114445050 /NCGR_PEP_ID=MMETSP0103-20121206/18413_1 /TAXON_ID=37642 ORGANISM="Paraphysomonas imperforata, Strain PA2" /NCGR_SAMPLE_ID=MMETSP0103 /ASSEMBLY_ACC=CAM_ASM_000201 /LENGTH=412 /DNA_ID=CAMNT_0001616629 /DNA_START=95 /DNA_END=1333 /DNA_ORIENTATION=+
MAFGVPTGTLSSRARIRQMARNGLKTLVLCRFVDVILNFHSSLKKRKEYWLIVKYSKKALEKTKATLRAAGLPIYYEADLSFIVGGGSQVPNVSGLDGCGAIADTAVIPVPSHGIQPPFLNDKYQQSWTRRHAATDPRVEQAVAAVSESSLISSVTELQAYHTRNSYSETIYEAEAYLADRLSNMGFSVETMKFRPDMSPNVIATWNGKDTSQWIVAGAHYDSRSENSSSRTNRAPGADDNGSGTSAMLELAHIVNSTSADFTLERGLKLCFFSGEEQGLLGSRALAAQYKENDVNVVAMVNADMLGYQATSEVTLGFKDRSVTPELVALSKELTTLYVPGLPTADSSSCCSDYLSFWEEGFPSVGFFENGEAASNYPSYHTETDLIEYVNTKQLALETQAVAATVFTLLLD